MTATQPDSSRALARFVRWHWEPPYEVNIGTAEAPQILKVLPVRCKTGYGAARQIMLCHTVTAAAAVVSGDRIVYAARWICSPSAGATDVVFIRPEDAGRSCRYCAVKSAPDGPGVYRLFGADGTLLYIGSSERANLRVARHMDSRRFRDLVKHTDVTPCRTLTEARAAEVRAIGIEGPLFNVWHSRARAA